MVIAFFSTFRDNLSRLKSIFDRSNREWENNIHIPNYEAGRS